MTFIRRQIQVDFDIGEDQFSNGTNTLSLTGLRMMCSIQNINGFSLGTMNLRIYGMQAADMNKLTNLGKLFMAAKNYQVTVSAGDDNVGLTKIYTGTVYAGQIIYDQPNVCLEIQSMAGFYQKMTSADSFSQGQEVNIADAVRSMLPDGFNLVSNFPLTARISNPYYSGSSIQQIKQICADAGVNCDIRNNTVYIWPIGGSIDDEAVSITPSNGLVAYPSFDSTKLILQTEFNPNIVNGKRCNVESDQMGATGDWVALVVGHNISAEYPGGPWTTEAQLAPPDLIYPNGQ